MEGMVTIFGDGGGGEATSPIVLDLNRDGITTGTGWILSLSSP